MHKANTFLAVVLFTAMPCAIANKQRTPPRSENQSAARNNPKKASMGGGDEEEEEQKKLHNLGFEASNPKRKKEKKRKERKTSLKPWTSSDPTWATSGYETHARSFTGFLLDHPTNHAYGAPKETCEQV